MLGVGGFTVEALPGGLRLVVPPLEADNSGMELLGHIHNGVVVLDDGATLPEGTRVSVSPVPPQPVIVTKPGELPVVVGGAPGSLNLTNERINAILEEEDVAAMKGMWNVPS
jgi:hypothetical protein